VRTGDGGLKPLGDVQAGSSVDTVDSAEFLLLHLILYSLYSSRPAATRAFRSLHRALRRPRHSTHSQVFEPVTVPRSPYGYPRTAVCA